jgi:hypothetical protein
MKQRQLTQSTGHVITFIIGRTVNQFSRKKKYYPSPETKKKGTKEEILAF